MTTTENPYHLGAHEGTGPTGYDDPTDQAGVIQELRSGIRVMFDLSVNLGKELARAEATHRSLLAKLEANTPIDYATTAAATYPSSGALILNLGNPDQGTYWEVQSVTVGGTDQNVTATGTAGLYVCSYLPPTSAQSPGLTSLVDTASTLPNVGFYGGRQCFVQDQEYLFLIVWGGTAGQQYQANAQVAVFRNAAAGGKVTAYT